MLANDSWPLLQITPALVLGNIQTGQLDHRLNVRRSREQIHRLRPLGHIAQGGKPLQIPAQGGGVTGYIHHPGGRHAGDGVHHVGGQPLPGRVHHDDVGGDALLLQLEGQLGGIAAQETGLVRQTVAPGVLLGVLNGLGHHFHPDDVCGVFRHGQGDGADAAVQVHHRLGAREARKLHRPAV